MYVSWSYLGHSASQCTEADTNTVRRPLDRHYTLQTHSHTLYGWNNRERSKIWQVFHTAVGWFAALWCKSSSWQSPQTRLYSFLRGQGSERERWRTYVYRSFLHRTSRSYTSDRQTRRSHPEGRNRTNNNTRDIYISKADKIITLNSHLLALAGNDSFLWRHSDRQQRTKFSNSVSTTDHQLKRKLTSEWVSLR